MGGYLADSCCDKTYSWRLFACLHLVKGGRTATVCACMCSGISCFGLLHFGSTSLVIAKIILFSVNKRNS